MKKRVLSLMLLVAMLLSTALFTASCREKSKIQSAIKRTAKLESIDADITMSFSIAGGKAVVRKHNVRINKENEEEPLIRIDTTIDRETTKAFLDNNTAYIPTKDSNGYTVSREEYYKTNPTHDELLYGLLKELPDTVFENATSKKDYNLLVMSVNLSSEEFTSTYSDYFKGLEKCMSEQISATDIVYNTCYLSVSVRRGYVYQLSLSFDVSATVEGETQTVTVFSSITLNNAGRDIEVRLPTGKDGFAKK